MKKLLIICLVMARLSFAAAQGISPAVIIVPAGVQARIDSAQNAQLSAMGTMTQTLSTDGYANIVGNLLDVLSLGTRKGVYNTALPLPETWIGTGAGNRLATMRIVNYPVTVASGQTVINIPHGLPYTPVVQLSVALPAGVGAPAYTVNATNIVVTLPTAPLIPTPYVFNWMGR